jgi:hypothetical protein
MDQHSLGSICFPEGNYLPLHAHIFFNRNAHVKQFFTDLAIFLQNCIRYIARKAIEKTIILQTIVRKRIPGYCAILPDCLVRTLARIQRQIVL